VCPRPSLGSLPPQCAANFQRYFIYITPTYKTSARDGLTDLSEAGLEGDDVGGAEGDHDCLASSGVVGEERGGEGRGGEGRRVTANIQGCG